MHLQPPEKQYLYDVVVAGHLCLDIIPAMPDFGTRSISQILLPGKLINVGDVAISTGGPVSNTGIALKKLGLKVAFMATVGADDFGALILKRLRTHGEVAGIKQISDVSSSYTVAIVPPGIDRIFLHNPGTNDTFTSADINFELVKQAKVFHLGYPTLMKSLFETGGAKVIQIFQLARSTGVTTSLDMSLPDVNSPSAQADWPQILKQLLSQVDLFLPSIEEAYFLFDKAAYFQTKDRAGDADLIDFIDPGLYSKIAQHFLNMGTRIVVLKCAHRGIFIKTGASNDLQKLSAAVPLDLDNWANREIWCPAFEVPQIASATGAGDSAIAGFYAAFLRGHSIEKTVKFANCLGYQNLQALDAVSGIKSWPETLDLVEHQPLKLIELNLKDYGWQWDPQARLWNKSQTK